MTFPCGLGAIASSLMAFLQAGNHLLMPDQLYGPARAFCDDVLIKFGVEVTYYDSQIGAGIAALMRPNTRVVYLESPGSLTFDMQDVGTRYYTYPTTMAYAMEAAARDDVDFYVLDRPDPITASTVQGAVLDQQCRQESFQGCSPSAW